MLTGMDLETFQKSIDNLRAPILTANSGLDETYLFDFKNYASQYNGVPANPVFASTTMGSESQYANHKIKIKPIDALKELETVPTPFALTLLDEKISILQEKRTLIVQLYARKDIDGMIQRIENRKRYLEFKTFYDGYQNTTDEKIEELLQKYDLLMNTSDIFIPEFPDVAITAMKAYTEQTEKLCGKKPVFYVIAAPDLFQDKYKRRDPILLVQSPFGFYWQIIGAWDKEMLLLSEL
jgi:hypothetical protein